MITEFASRLGGFFALSTSDDERSFSRTQLVRACVVAAVVIIALLSLLVLGGLRMAALLSDLASYHLPKYQYVAERVRAGGLPLWNPWEFGGIPLLASLQPGVFYPPVVFFYSLWSGDAAHLAFLAFHVGVGALGTLLLMRSFGCAPWPSVLASLWVTQPLWLARIYDHPNFIATVCWIPWLLFFLRRCLLAPTLRDATGLAVVAALQFFAGYPPATFATAYVLVISVPFWLLEARGAEKPPGLARTAAVLAIAGVVGALLVAGQLLPTAELALLTNRQGEAAAMQELLRGHADTGGAILFLLGTPAMTFVRNAVEFWTTFGPALIVLALVGVALDRRRTIVWYLVVTIVLSGLLPYPAYGYLPFYGNVRWALEWHLIAPQLVCALAGLGLDALLGQRRLHSRHAAACALIVVVVSLGWNWWFVDPRWPLPKSAVATPIPEWVQRYCRLDDESYRAFWPHGLSRGSLFTERVRSIGGYDQSLLPARVARLNEAIGIGNGSPAPNWAESTANHAGIVSRMALRCAITPRAPVLETAGFQRYGPPGSDLLVYTNPSALPRARLTRRAKFVASPDEALAALTSGDAAEVVIEGSPEELPDAGCSGPAGEATITADRPEEVRIETRSSCAAHLVLADTHFPGWTATVDGTPAPIGIADYGFRTVVVPAGKHEVVFRYAPWTVPVGVVLSVIGLALAAAAVLLPRRCDPLRVKPAGPVRRSSR